MIDYTPDPAPMALFVYRRPEHARRAIKSLQACTGYSDSPLFVFADGPKRPEDEPAVEETRRVVRGLLGDRAVYVEQNHNRGLAASIIDGVSMLCNRYGKVIVVEDDLIVAPEFLMFLNSALERYANEPRVMQVSGHMFDVPELRDQNEALLLPFTTSWGWATWKRAWRHFDSNADGWERLMNDRATRHRFDLNGHYPYSRMLRDQMQGQLDSWAIRWYHTVFRREGLVIYPPTSLVENRGFDGSGTHSRVSRTIVGPSSTIRNVGIELPDDIRPSDAIEQIHDAISVTSQPSFSLRAKSLLRHIESLIRRKY